MFIDYRWGGQLSDCQSILESIFILCLPHFVSLSECLVDSVIHLVVTIHPN